MRLLRVKRHTFKIILLTSFLWLAADLLMLLVYSECSGEDCRRAPPSTSPIGLGPGGEEMGGQYSPERMVRWQARPAVQAVAGRPGEGGTPVKTPSGREEEKKEKFKINQFNLLVSEMISVNRSLKDYRLAECLGKQYPALLPRTSIVIVFHNEAWSTLLRTLHSIINRSPLELIQEILLVDDASPQEHLGSRLEQEVARLPVPVRVLRTGTRSGLIRARLLGASEAQGDVLTFLDSHVETTEGWLEPLLAEVATDRRRVACPIIDVISDETFEYVSASDMTWGGFNWKLNFRWYRVPQRELERRNGDRSLPLRTPTMAGGLFAIDREYFYHLGAYDEGMDIWGGENLELSFRIWMCGGILLISTCSHVGHVFRKSTPYTFPGGTSKIVNHNNARLAEVWMDEWKDFYFSINPGARKAEKGDLSKRKKLRQDLKCKSFRWYLETIYPESQMPLHYVHLGEVRGEEGGRCLDTMSRKAGQKVGLSLCHGLGGNQVFAMTEKLQIMSDDNCLDAASGSSPVKLVRCHGLGGNQAWVWRAGSLRHKVSGKCLTAAVGADSPEVTDCNPEDPGQRWSLGGRLPWQAGHTP